MGDGSIAADLFAAVFSFGVCQLVIAFFKLTYDLALIHIHLYRKLIHISAGLIVMLCWPMFSGDLWGRVCAALIPGLCVFKLLVPALITQKEHQLIKLLQRYRDSRDLVQATLAYVLSIAFTTVFYWRTPLAIAVICSLCAGDGVADIAGRRFGGSKLPYNKSKTFAGSFGMALAAFLASLLYMYYFSWLEYIEIEATPNMVLGFFLVSVASALVESFPFSPTLDDNLTVPLASFMLATFLL
ncbi:probable phytol kinase 3, chloroplastic [Sesamum indicum]|uniref:Probable phytol kinase 3, chloroplastic n=1 Tax=Sesamum indicum TaxID=4182 RepID=A0A6I9UJ37_SESIN|nr:probable phytol kinase 3, chloroplastic [Sesamum indicum]